MRLTAATMLVASLLALSLVPAATAGCRISISDPTSPYISKGCTEIEQVENAANSTSTFQADADSQTVVSQLDSQTGICDTDVPCSELLDISLSVTADPTDPDDPVSVVAAGYLVGMEQNSRVDAFDCELDPEAPEPSALVDPDPCLVKGS